MVHRPSHTAFSNLFWSVFLEICPCGIFNLNGSIWNVDNSIISITLQKLNQSIKSLTNNANVFFLSYFLVIILKWVCTYLTQIMYLSVANSWQFMSLSLYVLFSFWFVVDIDNGSGFLRFLSKNACERVR